MIVPVLEIVVLSLALTCFTCSVYRVERALGYVKLANL